MRRMALRVPVAVLSEVLWYSGQRGTKRRGPYLPMNNMVRFDCVHELGDYCHLGLGVNRLSRAEEVLGSESVRVEITTIFVTVTVVARVARTAGGVASARAVGRARVGSEGSRDRVLYRVGQQIRQRKADTCYTYSLPDIHLSTARAAVSSSRVGVSTCWGPSLDICLYSRLA